jgi:hypothetical protein
MLVHTILGFCSMPFIFIFVVLRIGWVSNQKLWHQFFKENMPEDHDSLHVRMSGVC